jgi:hypothetical protein
VNNEPGLQVTASYSLRDGRATLSGPGNGAIIGRVIERSKQLRPALVIAGVIGAVLLGCVALWWMVVDDRPRERDRVTHPSGYSVIKPRGWIHSNVIRPTSPDLKDQITLAPDQWIGLAPSMWVRRLTTLPDPEKLTADGFAEGTYHDAPAWVLQSKPKQYLFKRVIVKGGSDWYELGCSLPGLEGTRIDSWWQYLDSFRPISRAAAGG